jgi:hypothetical protein
MKSKTLTCPARLIPVLMLVAGMSAPAQITNHAKFSGAINDFTPATSVMPGNGGPWEVRGNWSLVVRGNCERGECKAEFFAALTMERSDLGVVMNGGNDLNNPVDRMAHTHHITLNDGDVTAIPNGIQITGPATITANGSWPPPFGSTIPTLTIQITGGTGENSIAFSNITIVLLCYKLTI